MRTPLIPMDEESRRKALLDKGLGPDLLPLSLSDDERKAAQRPGLPEEVKIMPVSPKLVAVAATIAAILGVAYTIPLPFLPDWVPTVIWVLYAVACLFAGLGLKEFKGGGSLVPSTVAPILALVSGGLAAAGSYLTEGSTLQKIAVLASGIFLAITGKAVPVKPALAAPPA